MKENMLCNCSKCEKNCPYDDNWTPNKAVFCPYAGETIEGEEE